MKTRGTLRLATRGSTLARRQATLVTQPLEDRGYEVDLVTVETTGDQLPDELIHRLGTTGAFVRELDERVLDGSVDGAIHSMKDVPTEQPTELVSAAVPERGRPSDVLVTPDGISLDGLPEGATVGTSSLRRGAQLQAERPDLTVEPLRGNVDTRLEKLLAPTLQREREERQEREESDSSAGGYKPTYDDADTDDDGDADENADDEDGSHETAGAWVADLPPLHQAALERDVETEYDAIVLAEAGLHRSGLAGQVSYQRLETTPFVPAPGQGALVVTALDGDTAHTLQGLLDHPRSRVETTVERTILAELGGGCIAPVGIYAVLQGEYVHATVGVYDRDGTESVTASRDLPVDDYAEAARAFARDLADRGAAALIDDARRDQDEAEAVDRTDASGDDTPNGETGDDEPGGETDVGPSDVDGQDDEGPGDPA